MMLLAWVIVGVSAAQDRAHVRVWEDTLQIPTYTEGVANPNPPFDLFSFGRLNYPYPIRDALTDAREPVRWRSLHLENEYLRLTVLPDLGGHVYSCLDKRSGREMFYTNTAIKKALIGYRGAWAAFGIEFNFPVSHNWMSLSPVDFAAIEHPDGSGSIWVGNVDQVYGGQWRVELKLEPGRSALEQHTDLYNASDVRHRYYWWNNAAVQVWQDSHLVYPTELMATHGFTRIEPWPIDRAGRDLSIIKNQTDGPVSLFTYGTREGFVGVYHPHTNSGTVHVADPAELPTHKVWSWGYDRDAAEWRTALSDDDSAYVELQSGLFRNQETYAFLEPQESVHFSEQWLPVRDLGGITRANAHAVLYMNRPSPGRIGLALDVTRNIPDARLTVRSGDASTMQARANLTPREVWRRELDAPQGSDMTFEITDARGKVVLTHTEHVFDHITASAAGIGPQPSARRSPSPDDVDGIVEAGTVDELEGRRLTAMSRYQSALVEHPQSVALLKAAGRMGMALGWTGPSARSTADALTWLEAAHARNVTDFEVEYYLGLALADAGRTREALEHLQGAQRFRATRTPATLQLARLLARGGQSDAALRELDALGTDAERASVIGGLEVTLLRQIGRTNDALQRALRWRSIDPTSSYLRHELVLLGQGDPGLWLHLGADANRVLDLVDQYLAMGGYPEALALLDRRYPAVEPPMREPGSVSPNDSPLVAYYRGYVRSKTAGNPAADYRAARSLATAYVFPNRRSSFAVLAAAVEADPADATAQFLLGSLHLAKGLVTPAIAAWQNARRLGVRIPTLHRNLALALLEQPVPDYKLAREVLQEGVAADSRNVEVYTALDAVLSATAAPPAERVKALRRYPVSGATPPALVLKLALALADADGAEEAERLFHDRFFPREEGGTSVRTVYAQVRLASAAAAAQRGSCETALAILESLSREQAGLALTSGGLADTLGAAPMALQIADIESACGKRDSARSRWERLARALQADGAPLTTGIADVARARLGRQRTPQEQARVEQSLAAATATLESGATSSPGLTEYARSLLLAGLGRADEAHASLQRVFLYPDRGLSHALARAAFRQSRSGQ
jgi:tetratricopeptide (TPR) repeat protein